MRKKIIGIFVCMLMIVPIFTIETRAIKNNDPLEGGWLEEREGIKILHLSGSNYEMGYQHGYFLKNEIREVLRAWLFAYETYGGYSYDRFLEIWNVMDEYLPDEYKAEMQGMADGSGMSFDDICVLTTIPAVINLIEDDACCEISLWGDATVDGKLYHVRSLDFSFDIYDPETGKILYDNLVMIVRDPDVGYTSLDPDLAGSVGSWQGINEKGIAIGEDTCTTHDVTFQGICPWMRMRMVLDHASTSTEAIDILVSNRTCGTNFILSDANIPIGYALDQTANVSYVGTWDDPVEGLKPFWQIKDVVRRVAGLYIDPECAALEHQRYRYNPGGFLGLFLILFQKSYMFAGWTHYKALSTEVQKRYGSLDLNETMSLLRDEYVGNTDFFMKIFRDLNLDLACRCQWVCCPETGDIVISFARNNTLACYNQVYYFNMFELFNSRPPQSCQLFPEYESKFNVS